MTTRSFRYLLQSDPTAGRPLKLNTDDDYTFDLGLVGAAGMKELIATCRAGSHLTSILSGLLTAPRHKDSLVWRGNGPGVGWEMRSAWSGLFGRFFARAYLENEGFTWIQPIERSYNRISDDIVVSRMGEGEIADWICAKDETSAHHGEIIVAEAKGRHREGNLQLGRLPRPLQTALDQLQNTVVTYRDSHGVLQPCRTKGYAILTKWVNEHNVGRRRRAILRVVDPETPGAALPHAERKEAINDIGKAAIAGLLRGLGFEGLAFEASPVKESSISDPVGHDADVVFRHMKELVRGRASSRGKPPERGWVNEQVWRSRRLSLEKAEKLIRAIERQYEFLRDLREEDPKKSPETLRKEAREAQPRARAKVDGIDNVSFVGDIIGINGPIETPLNDALSHLKTLPKDMAEQFIFVGVRSQTLRRAVHDDERLLSWKIANDARKASRLRNAYAFSDGVLIAPALQMEADKPVEFF